MRARRYMRTLPLAVTVILVALGGRIGVAQAASQELAAQTMSNGLRVLAVQVDKVDKVSLALALPVGWRHDPAGQTGLAELLRWWIRLAQRDQDESHQFLVTARPDHTMIWYTGPKKFFTKRLQFLERVLAADLSGDADLHAVASGRARLLADDHVWLVPGKIIRQKAWRTLSASAPLGRQHYGIPQEMKRLTADTIRQRLRSHYGPTGAVLVLIGDFRDLRLADVQQRFARIPARAADRSPQVHDSAPSFEPSSPHERVDGPYVSAAVLAPLPSDPDFLAFVLGVTVLRSQAQIRFGAQRGNEWKADFPYLAFRYWEGDRLVFVNRRGHNASSAKQPRQEIEGLLEVLRTRDVRERELTAARREVANILAEPPFDQASGPLLAVRARRLAMSLCLADWPLDLVSRLENVTSAEIDRALRKFLAPERLRWFELTPTAETHQFLRSRRR
jgi:predicted Zn-dependent peptidase